MFLSAVPLILWGAYANYFNSKIAFMAFGFDESWLEIIRTRGIIRHWFDLKFYTFLGGSIVFLLLTPLGFLGAIWGIRCAKKEDKRKILYI